MYSIINRTHVQALIAYSKLYWLSLIPKQSPPQSVELGEVVEVLSVVLGQVELYTYHINIGCMHSITYAAIYIKAITKNLDKIVDEFEWQTKLTLIHLYLQMSKRNLTYSSRRI